MAYLVSQIEQRSEQMDDAIITRRIKGLPDAKSVVVSNRQSGTMDAIQDVVGQMRLKKLAYWSVTGRIGSLGDYHRFLCRSLFLTDRHRLCPVRVAYENGPVESSTS